MEMAQYIYAILKSQLNVMWSWGFNSPQPLTNCLQFKVQGFKHKGYVTVKYNEGKDLFDVTLYNNRMTVKEKTEGVYFDELVDIIDGLVEKTADYESRVKQEYSL